MPVKGKITSWNDDKGFGFITPVSGGKQVFVHIKAFGKGNRRPGINQIVTYNLSSDWQGRPCAVNAMPGGDGLPGKARWGRISAAMTGAAVFKVLVCIATLAARIPPRF
jgi:cold shock CspA family protein